MISKSSILFSSEVMAIKADYEKHGFDAEFETNFEHAYKQVVVANPNTKRTEAIFEIATILLGLLEGLFPKAAKAIGLFGRIGLLIGRVFRKG